MTWVNLVVAWSHRFGLLGLFAGGSRLQVPGYRFLCRILVASSATGCWFACFSAAVCRV